MPHLQQEYLYTHPWLPSFRRGLTPRNAWAIYASGDKYVHTALVAAYQLKIKLQTKYPVFILAKNDASYQMPDIYIQAFQRMNVSVLFIPALYSTPEIKNVSFSRFKVTRYVSI